jgi:hypothetical protein
MNKARATLLMVVVAMGVTACEERKPQPEEPYGDVVSGKTDALQSWIHRNDDIDPALWLASKEAGHRLSPDDAAAARLKMALEDAAPKFLESDRMVANRTAQLAEMLAKDGKPETAVALIDGLSSVVSAAHGKETYGELCQFYFTLRHGGADRAAALAELRRRYGSSTAVDRQGGR